MGLPRLPIGPDPLGRIRVPRDLAAVTTIADEAPPEAAGLTERQVRRIWAAARNLYDTGVHPALTLCVRRNGHVVIDRAIGHARGNGPHDRPGTPTVLATPETPFCVFSTAKGITALVVHMLAERGALGLEDRVIDYLPEYGRHGKASTTIAHLLAHRAAVPWLPRQLANLESLTDMEAAIDAICAARPFAPPGRLLAYHAISGGIILGEIVRRATDRSIDRVLAEAILDPLGFRWCNYGVAPEDVDRVAVNYATGPPLLPPVAQLVGRALSQPIENVVEISNDPRFLTSVIPSATTVATANELSRFFEIFRCGGSLDGHYVMSPHTLRHAVAEQSRLEPDFTLVLPIRFSLGLMLGAKVVSLYGLDTDLAFGHLGLINIVGWADPERGVSGALLTSGKAILYPDIHRFWAVMQTIAAEIPKLPVSARPF
ncbi:MAG TPA: serine hydrolase domain-containing protein [Solirubrobacteraceae bacterium]|nr:serine hydrolase domain-containing protein [Solirubrobacteraceae bacterium]